jgi:hypothetical protein
LYGYVGSDPINAADPSGLALLIVPIVPPWPSDLADTRGAQCWASCVEQRRLDSLLPLAFTAVPKRIVPPFRIVYESQP